VKPHGALYHVAGRNADVANVVARAAARWSRDLVLVAQAGSAALDTWRALGFATGAEAFVDRRYEADGRLRERSRTGALLTDPTLAATQALRLALGGGAFAEDGTVVPIACETICLHADTPGATDVALKVRGVLRSSGVALRPLSARGR
jgi:UPF0271 protein